MQELAAFLLGLIRLGAAAVQMSLPVLSRFSGYKKTL
jgi:hypothetical protein